MQLTRRLAFAFAVSITAAAAAAPACAEDKLKVVASFSILADMVQQVGGNHVDVVSLVGPNQDAHAFTPSPADAAKLADSSLFVVNGLGFEGWLSRITEAIGYKGTTVIASDGITKRAAAEEHHEEDASNTESDHDHDHGEFDPHAWQDLSNGMIYARNIASALCEADKSHCADYQKNAAAYVADMQAVDAEIKSKVTAIPAGKRKVITTHDAFGYYAAAYGITFLAPQGISTESEASAQGVAELIGQIREQHITALFLENMSDARLLEQIARETHVKPGGELFADALDEPGKPASTYLGMMRYNINQLAPAMAGS